MNPRARPVICTGGCTWTRTFPRHLRAAAPARRFVKDVTSGHPAAWEALLLAGRVVVFSDRPAHIRADFAVDFAYPRHRDHPELLRLRHEALRLLGLGASW